MRILKPFNTISTVVDDDLEKSNRRNKIPLPANEKEIRDHFKICLKMHAENKISAKNAWNLKIIDYMYIILYSKRLTKDLLQVAGTSLDACTKIYGIRVDDIHSNGLKLASNMARVDTPKKPDNPEEGDNDTPEEGDKENEAPKRKKKPKRINLAQKMTVTKDPKSLLDDVIKLESVFFQTHKNLKSSSTNNLFTNKLPMHPCGHKFMLLSKEQAWTSYDNVDPNIQLDKKYPFEVSGVNNLQICAPFADFEIDEWDPKHEDHLLPEEGISIPYLDGSVRDLFANADAENQYGSSEEEEVGQAAIQNTRITHIVDFKPEENGVCLNEYSYSTSVNLVGNKRITQVWAGPSHWRLKHIQPTISRFSGQQEKQTCNPARKAKIRQPLSNFLDDLPDLDKTKLFKSQRCGIEDDPFKCTLPQILSVENHYRSLMLKPVFIRNNVAQNEANEIKSEVPPYNYENPNDSQYCSQNGVMNDDDGPYDDGDFQNDEVAIPQQNFLEENLIDVPELVPKTYIPYALHAKKMNMKKLKTAVWKTLVSEKPNEIIPDEGMYKKKVQNTTFSNMYKQLPGRITEKMKNELSCPLAFVALLHLSNEQNLKLVGQPDFKDFSIQQEKHFTRS